MVSEGKCSKFRIDARCRSQLGLCSYQQAKTHEYGTRGMEANGKSPMNGRLGRRCRLCHARTLVTWMYLCTGLYAADYRARAF